MTKTRILLCLIKYLRASKFKNPTLLKDQIITLAQTDLSFPAKWHSSSKVYLNSNQFRCQIILNLLLFKCLKH